MKHPALTRIFSLVLAVLCLTMLLAGLGIVNSAMRARAKGLADYERLSGRVEEYRRIREGLDGNASYQEANQALLEEQERHQGEASQHRIDLAMYTATRGGLLSGAAALAEAESAFWQGKAQYLEGLALFEEQEKAFQEGYEQFQEGKKQLEEGRKTLELAESAMAGLRAQLNQSRNLAAILESDDENARQELTVAAYDSLLMSLDQTAQVYGMLKEQGGISPEQVQLLATLLAEQNDVDLSEFIDNVTWEGISAETLQEIEDQIAASTGMSMEEIRAEIQRQRDEAAAMDGDSPISEEQFAILKEGYAQSRGLLEQVYAAFDAKLSEYEGQLAESRAQLDEAQAQIDAMEPVLEQGKAAIEQARAALDLAGSQILTGEQSLMDARRQIEEQQAELKEKEEKLRREKLELDKEAQELIDRSDFVSNLKELERRETSVRLMLLEREEIRDRVDGGMELLPAAEDYASALLRQTEDSFRKLLWISALMVLGGIGGFLGIPSAFERNKSRFWLLAPVFFCLACAAAAEIFCRVQGRGDSYSAIAAAIFALIQLLLTVPKKRA